MTSQSIAGGVSRGSESRDARIGAATALVAEHPRLAEIRGAGSVLAECALGFA